MSCPHCKEKKEQEHAHACCCGGNASAPKSCCSTRVEEAEGNPTRERVFLLVSLASLIAGFALAKSGACIPAFPLTDPSWIAVVLCGFPILRAAKRALFEQRKITSPLLISIAIIASLALQFFFYFGGNADGGHMHDSYIFAAGEIAFLMALGEMIEDWTVKKSRKGIEALMNLAPKRAQRKTADGDVETVPVEALKKGDIVLVRPDDMIPADGEIIEGESSVNQASLTGESLPVDKSAGDAVLAGTWNQSGALTLRVTKPNGENTISRLIKLVREAEEKKAPVQHVADRWAARVVPAAILCSVLVGFFAYFVLGVNFSSSLIRGVTILVVFCPCAFALATPTAVAAGIGNAARRGILIKSGEALEKLARVDCAVFDKTGTLTRAELKIEAAFSAGTRSEKEMLALCAAAEQRSQHPIARALIAAAQGLSLPTARNIFSKTGIGVACDIDDEEILVCSFPSLEKEKIAVPADAEKFAAERRERGETLVCLVADSVLVGIFALSDTLRERIRETLAALKSDRVRTVMLTGDNAAAARHTAKLAGIDEVFSDLLPENKAEKITAMRGNGRRVLMVGDGVNDAPALASADCSVAMGALGSELAVETADIAILNDNVALIPGLMRFSKKVLKTIHINFGISLAINFTSVVLSALGVLDPVTGAIVHNASSIIVVSHSAFLLFHKIRAAE